MHSPRSRQSPSGAEKTPLDKVGELPVVVVAGLGPAGPEFTTPAVRDALMSAPSRYLRTERHPAAQPFVSAGVPTFDHYYESSADFEQTYGLIVEDLVAAAQAHGRVVYGVPGSPTVLERAVVLLRLDDRVQVETLAGLSFLDLAWDRLGIDPVNAGVRLINGENFSIDAAGERGPLLVSHTWSNAVLSEIKLSIEPEEGTRAVICHHLGLEDEQIQDVAWEDLDRIIRADHLTCLFIPELSRPPAYELARAASVVATLRTACPWDAEQTHQSLVRHLLEETYEAIEAIEELGDPPDLEASELLEEELGDVLCQVLFHATIASEEGLFSLSDVAQSLADKLIRRHPHVYRNDKHGEQTEVDAGKVLANWEQQKQFEKGRTSLTDGIPTALPALSYAAKLEKKASTVSFGVEELLGHSPYGSAVESLELRDEQDYGDLLFAIVQQATAAGVDPEAALRKAARRFRSCFVAVEELVRQEGRSFADLDHAARRSLWAQAIDEAQA